MASVRPVSLSELLERAAKTVERSRKLCVDLGVSIEAAWESIETVRRTDRRLEAELRLARGIRQEGSSSRVICFPPGHGTLAK